MIKNLITNTIPDICHFPGKSYKKNCSRLIFDNIVSNQFNHNILCPKELGIISIKSNDDISLIESQLYNCKNFTCLKFDTNRMRWKHIYKIYGILDHIKSCSFKYILYIDAYDVIINNPELPNFCNLLDNFTIIFNGERNFYNTLPQEISINIKNLFDISPTRDSPYKYLNAGCFFGKKEIILEYLSRIIKEIENPKSELYNIACDQTAIQLDYYLNQQTRDLIKLDTECKYFMCMNYLSSKDVQEII